MKGDRITFTMGTPDEKKHSTRFDFDQIDSSITVPVVGVPIDSLSKFKPSFYIPKPFAVGAKKVRVTIEVVE